MTPHDWISIGFMVENPVAPLWVCKRCNLKVYSISEPKSQGLNGLQGIFYFLSHQPGPDSGEVIWNPTGSSPINNRLAGDCGYIITLEVMES